MPLLTLTDFKRDWVNIADADTTVDATLTACLNAATAEIVGMANQHLEQVTHYVYFTGTKSRSLYLPYHTIPVAYVALHTRDTPLESWVAVTTGATIHEIDDVYSLYTAEAMTLPYYRLTATIGFASGSIPMDIQACCGALAKELYLELDRVGTSERFGVSAISGGNPTGNESLALKRQRELVAQRIARYTFPSI
jgi:hypothetical protein